MPFKKVDAPSSPTTIAAGGGGGGMRSLWKCEVICSMDQPVIEPPRSRQQAPRTSTVCLRAKSDERSCERRRVTGRHFRFPSLRPPGCVNVGRFLQGGAFTCIRRDEVLQGSFTDAGVSGFWRSEGESRGWGGVGVLMRIHTLGPGILRCPVIPSSIRGNRARCSPMSAACH